MSNDINFSRTFVGAHLEKGEGGIILYLSYYCMTLYSYSASFHPGLKMHTGKFNARDSLVMD